MYGIVSLHRNFITFNSLNNIQSRSLCELHVSCKNISNSCHACTCSVVNSMSERQLMTGALTTEHVHLLVTCSCG